MRGYVDKLSTKAVKGWAYDAAEAAPAKVRAFLHDRVIAEGIASLPKPSLDGVGEELVARGFSLIIDPIEKSQIKSVVVKAAGGDGEWIELPRSAALRRMLSAKRKPYQDFDGRGSSKSHEKLKALRLERIRGGDFTGMSVLDIGCNEGFFCEAALKRGANRVVGIDSNKMRVDAARLRVPDATFLHKRWWNLPEEQFDLIFFLSAIHYEPDQKLLLEKIRSRLKPDGVLVLECGIAQIEDGAWFKPTGTRVWNTVMRHDGLKRYPSYDLLSRELLAGYSVRPIGRSVDQKGDPVPRYVLHCSPRMPTALMIRGRSGAGKTVLAFDMHKAGLPVFRLDPLLRALINDERYSWSDAAIGLRNEFQQNVRLSLNLVAQKIVERGLADSFTSLIVEELPKEAELFILEGECLRQEAIIKALQEKLSAAGVRPWLVQPYQAEAESGLSVATSASKVVEAS